MVRRVVALYRPTPSMSILAPHLPPIRTRLTAITIVPRCIPHSTVHASCARPALLLAGQVRAIGGGAAHHIRRHRALLDEMRPTVCGALRGNATKLSVSDRQARGFHRPPAADGHVECWCRL